MRSVSSAVSLDPIASIDVLALNSSFSSRLRSSFRLRLCCVSRAASTRRGIHVELPNPSNVRMLPRRRTPTLHFYFRPLNLLIVRASERSSELANERASRTPSLAHSLTDWSLHRSCKAGRAGGNAAKSISKISLGSHIRSSQPTAHVSAVIRMIFSFVFDTDCIAGEVVFWLDIPVSVRFVFGLPTDGAT